MRVIRYILLISLLVFIAGCQSAISGKAVTSAIQLISSEAPSTANLNDVFNITCDYGQAMPCFVAMHNGKGCTYINYLSATNVLFQCKADSAGLKENYCARWTNPADTRCDSNEWTKIQSTEVKAPIIPSEPLKLMSSEAPTKVYINEKFNITCDYGEMIPCFTAMHNGKVCTWIGPSGTKGIFECKADTTGTKTNICARWESPDNAKCDKYEETKIQETSVYDFEKLSLMSSSVPEEIVNGKIFTIKCDYGEAVPCFAAEHNGKACTFKAYEGTTGLFDCKAEKVGMANNYCVTWANPENPRCKNTKKTPIFGTDIISSSTELIDTLDFFVSNNRNKALYVEGNVLNQMSQTLFATSWWSNTNGKSMYNKWASNVYELHTWDKSYIYLKEDSSMTALLGTSITTYSYDPGIWMKRLMKVGESIDMKSNKITWYNKDCTINNTLGYPPLFPYTTAITDHNLKFNAGGDIGVVDAIILKYKHLGDPNFERFYYSRQWGWFKWEMYNKNGTKLYETNVNKISPNAPIKPITKLCTQNLK